MDRVPDDELISAYLDDELSTEERAYVERLLVERPEARRLLDELRGVRESLQTLPSYRLEPDFSATVLRQAEREVLHAPAEGSSTNGQVVEAKIPSVEPRRDVVEDHSIGRSSAGGSSISPSADEPRWRRPLAWSVLAIAAAVALMIVNQQVDREQPIAMNPAKKDATQPIDESEKELLGERAEKAAPEKRARDEDSVRLKANAPNMAKPSAPTPAVGAPLPKFAAPADMPTGGAFSVENGIAGQPVAPPMGQMSVANNLGVPAPATTDAIGDRRNLTKSGSGAIELNGANSYSGGGGGAQSLSTAQIQLPSSRIDTTPLVAANDYQRAQTLVAEWNEARRSSKSDDEAARSLASRAPAQNAQVENGPRQQFAPSQANDQLLIVTIEVPDEAALERCLLPVLQQQQIADLTTLRSRPDVTLQLSNIASNYGPPAEAASREVDDAAQPSQEEYVYVVAGSQQLEATLDALRKQTDTIVDLAVEPAPANARQQAWSGYSRGIDDGEKAKAAFGAVAAPANEELIAKKSEAQQERKSAEAADKQLSLEGVVGNRTLTVGAQNGGAVAGVAQQQADAYGGNLVPLSRSQRLRGVDATALQLPPQSGPASASQAAVGSSVLDRVAGEKSQSAAGGGSGGPSVAATSSPAAAPSLPPAPGSAAPTTPTPIATPQPAIVAAKAKDDGGALAGKAGLDGAAQFKQAADQNAALPQPQQFGYELPPDFHEALFICRVAPTANAAAKPTTDAKPAATAPIVTPPATPARGKAE